MPYKDPEDKQQWEREHREQRNARRRRQHLGVQMESIVPRSTPDPRFQKGAASALCAASRPEQRSPLLEVGYIVALLVVFFVGYGLVVYFARADKTTSNMQPPPRKGRASNSSLLSVHGESGHRLRKNIPLLAEILGERTHVNLVAVVEVPASIDV